MRTKRDFRPSCDQVERLEERLALSGTSGTVGSSVLLQGLRRQPLFRAQRPASVASMVDLAFQSFQQEYRQVRATYLAAVQAGTAEQADKDAFTNYTTQRVNLLAQQVTNSMLVYPKGATKGSGGTSALPLMVARINNPALAESPRQAGSMLNSLIANIPGETASSTAIALNTIAQDNAIESARVSTLNGVTIVRNGYYGSSRAK
jgi:hypothetical protein